MDIKQKTIAVIKKFEDGTAPFIIQDAFGSTERLGRLFASISEPTQANRFAERFMQDFSEDELNRICGNPSFIMALAAMLNHSLKTFGNEL